MLVTHRRGDVCGCNRGNRASGGFNGEVAWHWRQRRLGRVPRSALLPKSTTRRKASWIWRNISSSVDSDEYPFLSNMKCALGDGSKINFWEDFWTDVRSLKHALSRIYNLAVIKHGKVKDFGNWINDAWVWNVDLRRSLFEWEKIVWDDFMLKISSVKPIFSKADCLRWISSTDGVYSPKIYCINVACEGEVEDRFWNLVWANLAPPKVEFFVWRVVQQRIPSLTKLSKRGVVGIDSTLCMFCNEAPESINHLFCHCKIYGATGSVELGLIECGYWGFSVREALNGATVISCFYSRPDCSLRPPPSLLPSLARPLHLFPSDTIPKRPELWLEPFLDLDHSGCPKMNYKNKRDEDDSDGEKLKGMDSRKKGDDL
ncbi:hypothetical protein F3Y22_tig00111318pilonHSYRG00062 [Hibiscus syriacus]|uniref:Reverse transcriptase zinc-binding domain-containing protein n=1 Tax=Hibiscus syriacus TaxID=106335 RepID=A0A6A2YQ92_HIBSY|nr:hypothetical protein F3Y22_tig00111318pilonHSYRG00062 [Hibiscus syriacus]